MNMQKTVFLSLLMLVNVLAHTQELKPDRTSINYFYDAEAFMYEGNYDEALDLLLKLDNISPDNPNIWYKIGVCYLNTRLYKTQALEYLKKHQTTLRQIIKKITIKKKYTFRILFIFRNCL